MKNIFKIISMVFIGLLVISCEKDEDQAVLQQTKNSALASDAKTLVLLRDNEADKAVKFDWTNPQYNISVVYNNSLEFAKKDTGFKDAKSVDVNAKDLSTTYSVKEFNKIMNDAGFLPEKIVDVDVRMKTSVGNAVFYSNVISMTVTPYLAEYPPFYLVGEASAVGWNAGNAQLLYKDENISTIYTYLEKGKAFRFLGQQAWDPTNYSLDAAGIKDGNKYFKTWSTNLSVADAENIKFNGESGIYKIVVDSEPVKKTLTISSSSISLWNPTNLYLVGSVNGWNIGGAIPMTNLGDGKFEHIIALSAGSQLKFVGQQSWGELEWGDLKADSNTGYLAPKGSNGNIKFDGTGGNYKITVDLKLGVYSIKPL
ncbi:uncharacterized protein CHSO_1789 [Chryseobacterium sp. StRB126]|uniref:SusE domain-containing protein n=1 Tax=Chryseobacterium sp. StRB126 TaxID=878220 RepID=UPI0004E991CD|nr:SusE domain-containing protein [Chryseobacterium sp. StRB126]BAP30826.1 uncharacterized protein CHSO_1789 [Chryseobacterium sp. StRB126]